MEGEDLGEGLDGNMGGSRTPHGEGERERPTQKMTGRNQGNTPITPDNIKKNRNKMAEEKQETEMTLDQKIDNILRNIKELDRKSADIEIIKKSVLEIIKTEIDKIKKVFEEQYVMNNERLVGVIMEMKRLAEEMKSLKTKMGQTGQGQASARYVDREIRVQREYKKWYSIE